MAELTQEQPAKMSPEQAREMQQQQCLFCKIVQGQVSSRKVYEDEQCIAILDINPANPGHVLVLPKDHHSIMQLMPEDLMIHLFLIAKKISRAQIRALKAEGTNIFVANGTAAGQKSPHFMIHVIPRRKEDGITVFDLPKNEITQDDQEKLYGAVKTRAHEKFGLDETEPVMLDKPEPEQVEATQEEDAEYQVPPPTPDEEEFDKHVEEESGKRPDLDAIGGLFR